VRSVIETTGEPLRIEGHVFTGDCKTPVGDAILDIWHCDNEGNYDLKGYRGRGLVKTDRNGKYSFTTIFPPPYGNRPRHIHIKVRARGIAELTTQLYFRGDPNIQNDFARNAEQNRIISLKTENNLKTGLFDIYV
jgi:protocatechuate 3,4-dioxygenase beta subunit